MVDTQSLWLLFIYKMDYIYLWISKIHYVGFSLFQPKKCTSLPLPF